MAWVLLGPALIVALLSLFVVLRRDRTRREQGLPPDVPPRLMVLYRVLAAALLAFVAYSVLANPT